LKIIVKIGGKYIKESYYCFYQSNEQKTFLFSISTNLIKLPSLVNNLENLNAKIICLNVKNNNIIDMINNPDLKQSGLDLLKNEIIKIYRIK
jgi:hypothetical protein